MDNTVIENLRERISTEPSILFLGQDYLSSKTGTNLFYDKANELLCGGGLSSRIDYTELWNAVNMGKPLSSGDFEKLRDILKNIPEQRWLRKILCMRWGMIMTSAIDAVMYRCVGSDFSVKPISMEQRTFKRSYVSKRTINISYLYGTIDGEEEGLPPRDCSRKAFLAIRKKVNDRIDWIYNNILTEYGILVIDGWNPQYDWLTSLLENAGEMPQKSIYLFGATNEILENEDIKSLVEAEIVQTDERTFAEALDEIGFFEDESEDIVTEINKAGRIISLRTKKEITPIVVSMDACAKLDSHITVLYDDIWLGQGEVGVDPDKLYTRFQQQSDIPVWHLYGSKYGFYFNRTRDKDLEELVEKELRNGSYKRKYIMLEGNSNTGKTSSLIHLAYLMRNRTPVIYISGEPNQPDWMENLKEFIKTQFVDRQGYGKSVDSILTIWDANTDYNATQRCKQLQDVLRECNTVVVGSAYSLGWENRKGVQYKDTVGNHHLLWTADLDKAEIDGMLESLKNVKPDIYEAMRDSIGKNEYLLNTLQKLINLEYQKEWKQVLETLQTHFGQEVDVNEKLTEKKLDMYKSEMARKVEEEILKYGVASSWQMQLALIKKELGEDEVIESEKKKKLCRFEHMEKHIKKLNCILAIAGKFSTYIPLTLILRMIGDAEGGIVSDEQMFLTDIIQNDSLLHSVRDDEGYITVSFRHPSEAELYIEKNLGQNIEEIKSNEVKILGEMIQECKWQDEHESIPVLALVRNFGPNSWGTLNHPRMRGTRHYSEYEKWWKEIAIELRSAAEDQPEAVLVYALLMRSHCRGVLDSLERTTEFNRKENEETNEQECVDELNNAKEMLRSAIEVHNQNNRNQYCRLLGEMCANLVYGMKKAAVEECETRFCDLKHYFLLAVKNCADSNSQNLFTKNALLDIWLNGVNHYFKSKIGNGNPMENSECAVVVADSINYIDELLDTTEENFDRPKLWEKIEGIYKYADSDRLIQFQDMLEKCNNDTLLYLTAWKCWKLPENASVRKNKEDEYLRNIFNNLYLMPDDLDRLAYEYDTITKLKKYAIEAAQKALSVLDEKKMLIEKSKSTRCINMMIRAKWLVYTGNMPLETKQHPALTTEQWEEIGELCERYIKYADRKGEQLRTAPVMLRMVYLWCFSKNKTAFEEIRNRQEMLKSNDWYFERICICNPATSEPKYFRVNLQLRKGTNNKYKATVVSSIAESREKVKDVIDSNVDGKQVHVPENVAQVLMGNEFGNEKFNIEQPIVIWFNAKGPQIGLPGNKGGK